MPSHVIDIVNTWLTLTAVKLEFLVGFNYIFTADEGSDFGLDDYEEKFASGDLFEAGGAFALANFTFDPSFFVPGDSSQGCSANFQADCEANGLEWCSNFEVTIGSSAVDYSDPTAPKMDKIVGFGGRGISIFKVPSTTDSQIEFVWDSVRFQCRGRLMLSFVSHRSIWTR